MNRHRSITFRLTLLFATVSSAVLLLLGLVVDRLVERHFEELDLEMLDGKLAFVEHILYDARERRDIAILPARLEDALIGHHGLNIAVLTPAGKRIAATGEQVFPAALLDPKTAERRGPLVWTEDGRTYRGISAGARTRITDAPTLVVALSTDIAHHEHFMRSFHVALWAVVGGAALLTGLLGWFAARRGLAPLSRMRSAAAAITADRLHQRLEAASIPPELAEVAETLNDMLARLEASFQRLSDFSSDLAHELRTPVSNLLTQTQVMLSKARTADEYREVLASNAEEFERLSRMIADMLFLAKSDNHLIVPNRERVDLADEVRGLFEFYEALADEKGLHLACSGSGVVSGDRLMLRRAISNLLSNAIRHTPPDGRIDVRLRDANPSLVTLTVENTGETIPAEHLPRLFDRFYRVAAARQRAGEGAGLGLAITRSIARAHGGDALVRSSSGVTTFELRLPA